MIILIWFSFQRLFEKQIIIIMNAGITIRKKKFWNGTLFWCYKLFHIKIKREESQNSIGGWGLIILMNNFQPLCCGYTLFSLFSID